MSTSLTSTFKTILLLALVLVFSNSSNLRNKQPPQLPPRVNMSCEARLIEAGNSSGHLFSSCPNGKKAYYDPKSDFHDGGFDRFSRLATVFCC